MTCQNQVSGLLMCFNDNLFNSSLSTDGRIRWLLHMIVIIISESGF